MAKQALTVLIDTELMEELRDASVHIETDSIRAIVERSIAHELRRLRRRWKVGSRFPERHGMRA